MTDEEMCESCGEDPATPMHTCPYAEDVGNDSDTLCDCCAECEGECANDI